MEQTNGLEGLDITDDENFVGEPEPVPAPPQNDEPAAPAAAAPSVEPQAADLEDDAHMVPVRIMVEERRRLQAQIDAANQRAAEFETQLKAPPAPAADLQTPPEEIDFLEDPKGYIDAHTKALATEVVRLREVNEAMTNAQSRQQAESAFRSAVAQSESAFVTDNPDYFSALAHARTVRASQLTITNPEYGPNELTRQITAEENALSMRAFQTERSPAKLLVEYAKTLGWLPGQQAPAGRALPANTQADDDLAARRAAAGSLGAGGGGGFEPEFAGQIDPLAQAMRERYGR